MSDIAPVKCGDKSTRPPFKRAGELTWPMATCKLRRSRCSASRQLVRGSGVFRGEQHERRESVRGRRFGPVHRKEGASFRSHSGPPLQERGSETRGPSVRFFILLTQIRPNPASPGESSWRLLGPIVFCVHSMRFSASEEPRAAHGFCRGTVLVCCERLGCVPGAFQFPGQSISGRGRTRTSSFARPTDASRDSKRGNGPPDCTKSAAPAAGISLLKVGEMVPVRRYRVSQTGRLPHQGNIGESCLPDRRNLIGLCSKAEWENPDQMIVRGF